MTTLYRIFCHSSAIVITGAGVAGPPAGAQRSSDRGDVPARCCQPGTSTIAATSAESTRVRSGLVTTRAGTDSGHLKIS
eukprot:6172158-Pleurochrysis_carterae.AAC.1